MKYFAVNSTKITSPGEYFFVSLWLEQYHKLTIDTFRVRAMNAKSIIKELLEVINHVEKGIWDASNVSLICLEMSRLLKNDRIVSSLPYYEGLQKFITDVNKSGIKSSDERLSKLKIIFTGAINDLDKSYWDKLVQGLKKSILDESFDDIEWYAKTLCSELISYGFDRGYLYDLGYKDFIKNELLTFEERFNAFVEHITPKQRQYVTYLSMTVNKENDFPNQMLSFEFEKETGLSTTFQPVQNYILTNENKLFAVNTVDSPDPYTAALFTRSELGNVLDIFHYGFQHNNQIQVNDKCVVKDALNFIYLCDTESELVGFYMSSKGWLSRIEEQLNYIMKAEHITESSKDKIKGAMRYYRLSKETPNMEIKFLNLWIALEFLVRSGARHSSIIEPIRNYVPKSLALHYINRLIRDTIENIKRCKIYLDKEVRPFININKRESFIQLMRDQDLLNKLDKATQVNPLLNHRINKMKSILSTSNSIKEATEKNQSDIDLHLARMYRIRNKIVHSAAHNLYISGITANLISYVCSIINLVLHEISSNGNLTDLWDIYTKYEFSYDQYLLSLKNDHKNQMDLCNIINPLKVYFNT